MLMVVRLGLPLMLALSVAASAAAQSCSVQLNGGFRCDNGAVLTPNGLGGFKTQSGTVLSPDGAGGFRGTDGTVLTPNGLGGLTGNAGGAAPTTGGSYGAPLRPNLQQGPDYASGRRVGSGGGYAAPVPNRDCRADSFGGYRCR
jgi:hypothetical protein